MARDLAGLEAEQRACVVAAARGWVGTPYHHRARIKHHGVDCAQILIAVYAEVGLIDDFDPGVYPRDWHLHRSEERYAGWVGQLAPEYSLDRRTPYPGDIVLFKHGRTFSHGAIVTAWPRVVHAFAGAGLVEEVDLTGTPLLTLAGRPRPLRAFSFWER